MGQAVLKTRSLGHRTDVLMWAHIWATGPVTVCPGGSGYVVSLARGCPTRRGILSAAIQTRRYSWPIASGRDMWIDVPASRLGGNLGAVLANAIATPSQYASRGCQLKLIKGKDLQCVCWM